MDVKLLEEGCVNKVFFKNTVDKVEDMDELSELTRVDPILNMKGGGNNHVRLNKAGMDLLKKELPFLQTLQDMQDLTLRISNFSLKKLGKLDVLNAYS